MKSETLAAYPSAARRPPANLAFAALLFSFLGWAILERWSFGAGTGPLPHLINTLACAPLLACSLRRFRAACPRHMRARTRRRGGIVASGLALGALFALGAVCGMVAGSGSMSLLVLPAALCQLTAAALLCIALCGEELLRKKGARL